MASKTAYRFHFGVTTDQLKIVLLSVLTLFVLAGCGDKKTDTTKESQQHLKQAQAYTKQGQFGAAMIEARNAIQKNPKDLQTHLALVTIYNKLGNYTQTIKHLEQLKGASGSNYLFTYAEAYQGRGKYKSALELLEANKEALTKTDNVKYLTMHAEALASLGKFDESIAEYKEALETAPDNVDTLVQLAETYAVINEFHESYALLEKLDQLAPGSPDVTMFKAKLALRDGDLDKAETLLTDALSNLPNTDLITPTRAAVISALSEILTRQGRSSEALIYTRILAEAFPGAQASQSKYQEAFSLYKEGKLVEAEAALNDLLKEAPGHERAGQLLAIINYFQGDLKEAEDYFSNNLDLELAGTSAKRVFAMTNLKLQKPEEVIRILEEGIEESTDVPNLGLYGIAALSAGKIEKGVAALEKAIKLDPKQHRMHLALASYYNSGESPNTPKALEHIEKAYAIAPKDAYVQKAIVQQYMRMGKAELAQKTTNDIVKNNPEDYTSYLLAGGLADSKGDVNTAIKNFEKAADLAPNESSPQLMKGLAHTKTKDWAKAEAAFKKLIGIAPESIQGYQGYLVAANIQEKLGEAAAYIEEENKKRPQQLHTPYVALSMFYARISDFESAHKYKELAAQASPEAPQVKQLRITLNYTQGLNAQREQKYDEARTFAMQGLTLAPENDMLLTLLTEVELGANNLEEAQRVISQISEVNPFMSEQLSGDLQRRKDNMRAALKHYENAWKLRQTDLLGMKTYATLNVLKQESKATRFLDEWVDAVPTGVRARTTRGTALLTQGKLKEAQKDLEEGVVHSPNSPMLLNNLAWVYQELGNKNAETIAERAHKLAPENAAIMDTYGWILFQNGKAKEALPLLEKAHALAPEDKEIKSHLDSARAKS